MNSYDEEPDNGMYDHDDLESLGQRESWEHSQAEIASDREDDEDEEPDNEMFAADGTPREDYFPDPSYESREPKVRLSPEAPKELLPLPEGFQYWGMEDLTKKAIPATHDIAWFNGVAWNTSYAWHGSGSGPWALRVNSPIWRANCLFDPKEDVTPLPPSLSLRWYYSRAGSYVHVRVFLNGANCGQLTFRNEEFDKLLRSTSYTRIITFINDDQ